MIDLRDDFPEMNEWTKDEVRHWARINEIETVIWWDGEEEEIFGYDEW